MKPLSERIAAMEAQAAKPAGSVHSRFIPREEIDGVAAWHFAAVDGSEPRPAVRTDADAAGSEHLQAAREQAYAEGFQHGHDAGAQAVRDAMEATMRRTAEETAERMAQLLKTTTEQFRAMLKRRTVPYWGQNVADGRYPSVTLQVA